MNDFIAGYQDMLEDYLEPYDPKVYGRRHTLLNEVIYPLNPNLNWLAYITHERMKFEKTRKLENGVYNWWIHFGNFHWTSNHDMQGLARA
jgi:hypothetical protein